MSDAWAFRKATEIGPGDKVWTDDGVMTVISVTPGILPGHLSINWRGGFGEVPKSSKVESKEP